MKKIKILVPVGCRSEEGLSAPVIKRLQDADWCECHTLLLEPSNFHKSYQITETYLQKWNPDLVLCTADRIEMTAVACASFHNNIKIAHLYAGIINDPIVTLDDINRHVITLWSDIAFCEDYNSALIVYNLWKDIRIIKRCGTTKEFLEYDIFVVGITHMDDIEIDESLVPHEPYNLILINPITYSRKETKKEVGVSANGLLDIKIESNPDSGEFDVITGSQHEIIYDNLPRSQFLGLLKNCSRYITNSSSAYYEAPYFLNEEQIVLIGKRNKNRSTPKKLKYGASDKIVRILKEYFINEDERVRER